MGTGILALDVHGLSAYWPILDILAEALHWINTGIFILLTPMWIYRWLLLTKESLHTLTNPVQADFYSTFSIAMLVLATQWLVFSPTHKIVILILWWLGTILTFIFSFAVLFFMFLGNHLSMDHITPAKFIPAVGLVVIPLSGSLLLQEMSGMGRDLAVLVNHRSWFRSNDVCRDTQFNPASRLSLQIGTGYHGVNRLDSSCPNRHHSC